MKRLSPTALELTFRFLDGREISGSEIPNSCCLEFSETGFLVKGPEAAIDQIEEYLN